MTIVKYLVIPVRKDEFTDHEKGDYNFLIWMSGEQITIPDVLSYPQSGLSKNKRYAIMIIEENKLLEFTKVQSSSPKAKKEKPK